MKITRISLHRLTAVTVFSLILFIGCYLTSLHQEILEQDHGVLIRDVVQVQARTVERRLSRALSSTRFLALEVQQQKGSIPDFDRYAHEMLKYVEGVSNLQLAPNGIIEKIYPLPGNEKALGHNILEDDKRREEAHLAIKERRLTLAGPFELVQGGTAVIGRYPVFLQHNGQEHFWGFTSALIFLQELLSATDLDQLEAKGYRYQLSRVHPDTGEELLISASSEPLCRHAYSQSIEVPNATWNLTISNPIEGLQKQLFIGYLASFLVAIMATSMTLYILRQPEKLQKIVKETTKELEYLAYYDQLTGLANRRLLMEHLDRVCRSSERYSSPSALLFIDLDDFKYVNDSRGHDVGDLLLKEISTRLLSQIRKSDIVARLGGDEFAILLMNVSSKDEILKVTEKLIEVIQRPVWIANHSCAVTASIGIAQISHDANEVNAVLKCADLAMYESKALGKGQFCFFRSELQTLNDSRIERHTTPAHHSSREVNEGCP